MRPTLSLIRREFLACFLSPVAYVVLVVFLVLSALLFVLTMTLLTATGPRGVEYPMQVMKLWLLFLFLPPVLTMRLFAEERSTNTIESLMTAPVRDWQVVLAKFLGVYAFYITLLLPTLLYLPVILGLQFGEKPLNLSPRYIAGVGGVAAVLVGVVLGVLTARPGWRGLAWTLIILGVIAAGVGFTLAKVRNDGPLFVFTMNTDPELSPSAYNLRAVVDPMPVLTFYVGLLLAGGMFLAAGLFVSSLVRSQVVAFLLALGVSVFFLLDFVIDTVVLALNLSPLAGAGQSAVMPEWLSVPVHFGRDLARGVMPTQPLVLYASVMLFALFLTVRSLESQRWR